jgi:hypothetical protein
MFISTMPSNLFLFSSGTESSHGLHKSELAVTLALDRVDSTNVLPGSFCTESFSTSGTDCSSCGGEGGRMNLLFLIGTPAMLRLDCHARGLAPACQQEINESISRGKTL